MPFQSEAQRRFLFAKHPTLAHRWAREYGIPKDLPEKKTDKPDMPEQGAMESMKRFLSGQSGAEREKSRLKPPAHVTGPRG